MVLLEIDALSVRFGGVAAVTDVSLAVEAGEIHGIIGPNGAGKTSLINTVTGMVAPQRQVAMFFGTRRPQDGQTRPNAVVSLRGLSEVEGSGMSHNRGLNHR